MRNGLSAAILFLAWGGALRAADDLPAVVSTDAVAVVQWSGGPSWGAYEKTASYRAYFETGLVPAAYKVAQRVPWLGMLGMGEIAPADLEMHEKIARHLWEHGATLALGLPEDGLPIPYGLLVVPDAADWCQPLATQLQALGIQEAEVAGRHVFQMTDGVTLAFWSEGNSLVAYYGMSELEPILVRADSGAQLSRDPAWVASREEAPVGPDSLRVWLGVETLLNRIGPLPLPVEAPAGLTVMDVLKPIGLDRCQTVTFRAGYEGDHLVSEWRIRSSAPLGEWLGWQSARVRLADLPPLPADVTTFSLQVVDVRRAGQTLKAGTDYLTKNPEAVANLAQALELGEIQISVGGEGAAAAAAGQLWEDMASALGHVVCIYQDRRQNILPVGVPVIVISVADRPALIETLDRLAAAPQPGTQTIRDDRWGCPVYVTWTPGTINLGSATMAVVENWLVIAWQPQSIQTFVLRAKGELPRWRVDQITEATRSKLPEEFVRLTYRDPRPAIEFLMTLAPLASEAADGALRTVLAEIPPMGGAERAFSPLEIPASEVVSGRLFPNVSVTTASATEVRDKSYQSTSLDRPIYWAILGYGGLMVIGMISG